tara:strand:+ start:272 stop:1039 length:768 start_codon:yes stop_codon:yes gene_type:complete
MYNRLNIFKIINSGIISLCLFGFLFSEQSLAIVTKSNGNVSYKNYLKKEFINTLNAGSELFNNDLVRTGSDGFVKFTYLDDGTTIKINKDSELYIRGQVSNKNINKRINMSNGLIKLDVSKQNQDEFVIITPTSVASVKGTSFILDSKEDGDNFYGYEGVVEVLNKESNQVVRLSKNIKIVSKPDGVINSEIITQQDANVLDSFVELEEDVEIEQQQNESDAQEADDDSPQMNELRIKVLTPSGEEKTIIIKYNE